MTHDPDQPGNLPTDPLIPDWERKAAAEELARQRGLTRPSHSELSSTTKDSPKAPAPPKTAHQATEQDPLELLDPAIAAQILGVVPHASSSARDLPTDVVSEEDAQVIVRVELPTPSKLTRLLVNVSKVFAPGQAARNAESFYPPVSGFPRRRLGGLLLTFLAVITASVLLRTCVLNFQAEQSVKALQQRDEVVTEINEQVTKIEQENQLVEPALPAVPDDDWL